MNKIFYYFALFFKIVVYYFINKDARLKFRSIVISLKPAKFTRPPPHQLDSTNTESIKWNIICVDGHGHSGAGAVVDFLREFNNVSVYSTYDTDGTSPAGKEEIANNTENTNTEIKIITDNNGLLDLELILTSNTSTSSKSDAVNRFLALNEAFFVLYGGLFNDEYMRVLWNFIDSLCYFKTFSSFPTGFKSLSPLICYSNLYAPVLSWPHKEGYYFFTKKFTKTEFRNLAKNFLEEIIRLIPKKSFLMLDSLVSCSCGIDYPIYQEYIPGIKTVFVTRDPRDQYATACAFDLKWIPKDNIDAFIIWAKNQRNNFKIKHKDIFVIHFEDLVMNYEKTTQSIMRFFTLNPAEHIMPKKYFNPDISKKNVGLYKTLHNKYNEIKKIENELFEYCYFRPN